MTDPLTNLLPVELDAQDVARQFITEQLQAVHAKLADAQLSGFLVEFDPAEAELSGAFIEDALSEEDALDSANDLIPPAPPPIG
ncbi:MAG: hypothetical protein ACXVZT_00595 [Terriglobales bacterium]